MSADRSNIDDRETVFALTDQFAVLSEIAETLEPDQWQLPTSLPGWSVHDVLAHVIGTEEMLEGRPTPPIPSVDDFGHVHNPIGAINEAWVLSKRDRSPAEMTAELHEIGGVRTRAMTALTDEELSAPAMTPMGQSTYGKFMAVRLFDCWMHELDIRDAIGDTSADEGCARAQLAFATVEKTLAYIVGKKVKAPEGSRVTVHLTGPLQRTFHVLVDGRAQFVESLDSPATTTITVDSGLYVRLLGGRTTAAEHRDSIGVDGDLELANSIMDAMASVM